VLRSVGWLGADAFPTGSTDEAVYRRLVALLVDPFQPTAAAGFHGCSVCQFEPASRGSNNLFVPGTSIIYVCTELIVHYVNAHRYAPPTEFCTAVVTCPDTRSMEYKQKLLAAGGRILLNWAG